MSKKFLTGNEAFAYAALEAGVRVCAGYPGTPSSEVIETIARAHATGYAEGVHVEWSTNEKAALELLAGASYAGARTLFTCKQVGLNVASDALMSLNYVGIKGGMVLFVADDPGPISSQTEQDTRRFAAFAKVPVFDPATPEQGCAMMKAAFELSEQYQTPVIVRPTTRICHASTFFDIPDHTVAREVEGFEKDSRWVIFPRRSYAAHGEINERLPRIASDVSGETYAAFHATEQVGSVPWVAPGREAPLPAYGIVAGGISYSYVREALRIVESQAAQGHLVRAPHDRGDAPSHSNDRSRPAPPVRVIPACKVLQVGVPYPFPVDCVTEFVQGLERIIVFEELDYVLEDEMLKLAGRLHAGYSVEGKLTGATTARGENTIDDIVSQLHEFFGLAYVEEASSSEASSCEPDAVEPPARPPLLCPGCPHRGSFSAVKKALGRSAEGIFCGDIGCYTLGNAQPLNAVDTCLCMGAGVTVAQGFSVVESDKKALAFVGDSTFFASGMTGVANAVYNQHDITIVVLDNATTAMTGSQPHPGTGVTLMGPESEPLSIEAVLRSLGIRVITRANPLVMHEAIDAAREAIEYQGPSAVIFESPCIKLIKPQSPAYVVDENCTGCGRCVLKLGCPALSWNADTRRPVVDESLCNGCGLCASACRRRGLACESFVPPADDRLPAQRPNEHHALSRDGASETCSSAEGVAHD